jgi:hypothetical protein
VLEEAARLADDGTQLEFGGLKMGVDPLAGGSLQGAEQPIAPRIVAALSLGHSGVPRTAGDVGFGPVALLRRSIAIRAPASTARLYQIDHLSDRR